MNRRSHTAQSAVPIQEAMSVSLSHPAGCLSGRAPQSGAAIAHDTVATLYAGYVSAERAGQEMPVPVAPLTDLET